MICCLLRPCGLREGKPGGSVRRWLRITQNTLLCFASEGVIDYLRKLFSAISGVNSGERSRCTWSLCGRREPATFREGRHGTLALPSSSTSSPSSSSALAQLQRMRSSPSLGNMSRRPSKDGTPLLGTIHERRDSRLAGFAIPESPTLDSGPSTSVDSSSPFDSRNLSFSATAARRASLLPTTLRRKALRTTRTSRRQWILVFLLAITSYTLWTRGGGREHPVVQRAQSALLQQQPCRYLPFLHRCRRDPFAGLEYKVEGGLLYYPAKAVEIFGAERPLNDEPPPQPHPLHLLIKDAEAAWQEKVARQSRTLEEAVGEYERRYNQAPPLGFDKWWAFATEHDVQLLDEYDSIYNKILPYQSLPRDVLAHRSWMLQHDETLWLRDLAFTVEINAEKGGKVSSRGPMLHRNNRAEQTVAFLDGISQLVPVNLNLTITGQFDAGFGAEIHADFCRPGHDVPWIVPAGEAMENHRKAARAGKCEWLAVSRRRRLAELTLLRPQISTRRTRSTSVRPVEDDDLSLSLTSSLCSGQHDLRRMDRDLPARLPDPRRRLARHSHGQVGASRVPQLHQGPPGGHGHLSASRESTAPWLHGLVSGAPSSFPPERHADRAARRTGLDLDPLSSSPSSPSPSHRCTPTCSSRH